MAYKGKWLRYSLVLVTICGFLQEARSLRCYECTESDRKSCGEPFNGNNVTITDCKTSIYTIDTTADQEKSYACIFLKETDEGRNRSMFTRRCSLKNLNDTCENIVARNQANAPNIRTTCTQCERDLCNSSMKSYSDFRFIMIFMAFVMFRIYN